MGISIFCHFKDKLCHSFHNVTENQANGIFYESLWRGFSMTPYFWYPWQPKGCSDCPVTKLIYYACLLSAFFSQLGRRKQVAVIQSQIILIPNFLNRFPLSQFPWSLEKNGDTTCCLAVVTRIRICIGCVNKWNWYFENNK